EDLFAASDVRLVDQHLAIEASGAEQRRVEHLGPVGRAHDDHALARVEAVHLRQQLIQRLLALFVAAERALDANLAERVELVDEDDAGRLGFGLLEEVADARGADADEHLDELRSAETEKRHVGFAGDRAREQRLAGSRRADEQHAFRNAAAEIRVLLRVLQELDDLFQLFTSFVDAGDVGEAHLHFVALVDLRAAARERHDPAFGAAHAAEEEAPDADEEHERNDPAKQFRQPPVRQLAVVLDTLGLELFDQLGVFDARDGELPRFFFYRPADHLIADRDFRDLAVLEQRLELGVRNRPALRRQVIDLRQAENEQERQSVPER